MEKSLHVRRKRIISWVLILVGIGLLCDTNNNPTIFVERIFKPIEMGSRTLYYGGFFVMIIIYYGLKGINEYSRYELLKTKKRRIIGIVMILIFSTNICTYGVKISKSMSDNLNAIYYNRESHNNMLTIEQKENEDVRIFLTVELENCSEEPQEFYIDLLIPEYYNDCIVEEHLEAKDEKGGINKKFILKGKEKKRIEATFWGTHKRDQGLLSSSSSTIKFQFVLFNSKHKVKFIEKR